MRTLLIFTARTVTIVAPPPAALVNDESTTLKVKFWTNASERTMLPTLEFKNVIETLITFVPDASTGFAQFENV